MNISTSQAVPYGFTATWSEKDKYSVKNPLEAESKEVRLAIVGVGGVAIGRHLPALQRLRDTGMRISIVAGADLDPVVRANVQHNHGFPMYADAVEMFESHKIDGVLLLTDPGASRLALMEEAIRRKVHIFSEKPFLYFGPDALPEAISKSRAVLVKAREAGVLVMTGFVKRFSPPYQVAKNLIDEGAIGEISLMAIKMCQAWSRHVLLEGQACHLLHVARWLGGEIRGLHALATNRFDEPNYPIDNAVINVEFESGALGAFYFNSSSTALKPWERVEVFGQRKWLSVEDQMTVTLHDSDEGPSKVWHPSLPTTLFFDEEFSGFTHELRNFVHAVRGEAQVEVTGEDGVAALRLAHMIHTSARERRYVAYTETA